MRPEVRGQHTLRSATMSREMVEHANGICNRCGYSMTPYNGCSNCNSRTEQMGSGMQDPPLSPQIE